MPLPFVVQYTIPVGICQVLELLCHFYLLKSYPGRGNIKKMAQFKLGSDFKEVRSSAPASMKIEVEAKGFLEVEDVLSGVSCGVK